ncbi:DUF1622 domain-containing protein [uncultured Phenylobacterium sp.]|uniref:DUF1622 domain-containing protein n=1 Tax=uncultured Phenylobacterium sp. TaxID=349273 RepID=UPI0025E6596C|nr:DUF1622 domain-containing protein [uncultured Phenylobacterium sp.]
MIGSIQQLTTSLAIATDAVAVVVIGLAVIEALIRTLMLNARRLWCKTPEADADELKEGPRLQLAQSLALGLEFLLAADIMRTAVAPSWHEIGQVAAIAALRTALNFFIQREIDSAQSRRTRSSRTDPSPDRRS